ncbi:MAG: hypothetical protein Q8P26_03255 [Candidatus Levybacteria bacterium]|nr:hypothetical protein [Candidatus Levybacteria bacterium]
MGAEQKPTGFKGYKDKESNTLIESVVFKNGKQYFPTTIGAANILRRILQGNCTPRDLEDISKDPNDPYKLYRVKANISGINQGLRSLDLQIKITRKVVEDKPVESVYITPLHFIRR